MKFDVMIKYYKVIMTVIDWLLPSTDVVVVDVCAFSWNNNNNKSKRLDSE